MNNIYSTPKTVTQTIDSSESGITDTMIANLARGRKWAKFLGVCSYLYFVVLIFGLIFIAVGLFISEYAVFNFMANLLISAMIVVSIFFSFKIGRILMSYSRAIRDLQESHTLEDLTASQQYFRSFTKLLGLFFTTILAAVIVFFILMLTTGLGAMLFMN